MPHSGMVDALGNVRQAIRPGGLLVDLQPTTDDPLLSLVGPAHEEPLGRLDYRSDWPDLAAAEEAMATALARGWFARRADEVFAFDIVCDTLADFEDYQRGRSDPAPNLAELTAVAATALAGRGPEARLAVRRWIRCRTYDVLEGRRV